MDRPATASPAATRHAFELPLTPDLRVLLFTLLVALASGLIFGIMPALRGSRVHLTSALKEGTAGAGHSRSLLRDIIVVAQLAVSVIVLVGAGLCIRSLKRAQLIDPGFDTAHLVMAFMNPEAAGHKGKDAEAFLNQVVERVRTLPGVAAVTLTGRVPMQTSYSGMTVQIDGVAPPPGREGFDIDRSDVGAGYFTTMGTRLIAGRDFTPEDLHSTLRPVVINEAMAERFWPHQDALGKVIRSTASDQNGAGTMLIVGVAVTGKYNSLGEAPRPYIFRATAFDYPATIVARTSDDPRTLVRPMTRLLQSEDPSFTSDGVETLSQFMATPLFPARFSGALLSAFGLLALVLAIVGIYGVIAYSVNQRTREFGLRAAMGANAHDVVRLVLREAGLRAGLGVGLGIAGALLLLGSIAGELHQLVLYNVSVADPSTYLAVGTVLLATALLACYLPARRAASVDPMTSLRYE